MKIINKQKFLAELGRLLTFMYEEDRQTALAMYTRIFDMADDEQAVLQFLVSPTRQAVVLARTYDSAQRKLQAHSQHREDWQQQDTGETPAFVLAIEKLEEEALSLGVTAQEEEEDVNQFSLFDEPSDGEQAEAADASLSEPSAPSDGGADEDGLEPLPDIDDIDDAQEPLAVGAAIAAGAAAAQAAEAVSEPEAGEVSGAAEAPAEAEEAVPAEAAEGAEPDGQTVSDEAAPSPEAEEKAADGEADGAAGAEAEENTEADAADNAEADAVDAFLAGFSIKEDSEEAAAPAADMKLPDAPAAGGEELPSDSAVAADDALMPELDELDTADKVSAPVRTVRKPRVALLLLYIIIAVPIGLIAVLFLLLPTALSLTFGICFAAAGVAVLLTAFSFTMFADILAVFGAALILLALAVLFVWLFIWFIGGAIVGVVRGLCSLGRKWCYKEVPADE